MAEVQSILSLNDGNPNVKASTNDVNGKQPSIMIDNNEAVANINNDNTVQQPLLSSISDELSLQFRWSLWYNAPRDMDSDNKRWNQERVKLVVEFGTVQEFWRVFNNLCPPSNLPDGADLYLFRAGVSPAWEDPFNSKGGSWTYRIPKDDGTHKIDTAWFNSVLTMIGDNFDDADDICGLVLSIRAKTNRMQLWVRHADDREAVRRIGKQFKDINRIKQQTKIFFYSHDDQKDFGKPNKPSEMLL